MCLQVKFVLNDKTTLSDLLSLNLHKFEDEVKNIVDKAVKEMSMEKVLKELNTTWTTMEFEHTRHPRTGITMLQTSEELIETLEDNQVMRALSLSSVLPPGESERDRQTDRRQTVALSPHLHLAADQRGTH